jgi:hypothetical protein
MLALRVPSVPRLLPHHRQQKCNSFFIYTPFFSASPRRFRSGPRAGPGSMNPEGGRLSNSGLAKSVSGITKRSF